MNSTSRQIRVFISSTFRDMQEERDYLVKFIFPQLRKLCESRNITWGEVDLRWGITDEKKAEGNVLPVCLEEIKNCRPYFIGLLGERYGSLPDKITNELITREKWLTDEINFKKSITELEILHGVLNNPEMTNHAYFYFRDSKYLESVPQNKRMDYTSENAEAAEKLKILKKKIRDANDKQLCKLRDGYRNPEVLGRVIRRDFTCLINKLFPADDTFDTLGLESGYHEAFAARRSKVYISRKEYFDRLDEHLQQSGLPLVVSGEAGSGKSALLANWYLRCAEGIKVNTISTGLQSSISEPSSFFLIHFIGATPYSSDWAYMLKRIIGELKRHFNIEIDIPDKPDGLRSAFSQCLYMAADKGRVILILDSLNQLEDHEGAFDLVWLPPIIPQNIRLIVSTLPGRQLDNLNKRGWPVLEIKPMKAEERLQFIIKYLEQYTKSLNSHQYDRILNSTQTANPLYLRTLLEELRLYGDHYTLDQYINHYLTANTVTELYEKILKRYETDYDRDHPGLVRDAMTALWAARRGLSEIELLEVLGSNGQPLPGAYWSPLYLAAEQLLVNHSGLIGFFHDNLRQAIQLKFLQTEEQQKAAHLRLANYFSAQPLNNRKLDEQPWQDLKSGQSLKLRNTLCDLSMFNSAWNGNRRHEWLAYWTAITDKYNPAQGYEVAVTHYIESLGENVELGTILRYIGWILHDMSQFNDSLTFKERALRIFNRLLPPNHTELASCLNDLAEFHRQLRHYSVARQYFERALLIIQNTAGIQSALFASTINNIGVLKMGEGDYVNAVDHFRKALEIWEAVLPMGHHERIVGKINLSNSLRVISEDDEAATLGDQAVQEAESFLGQDHHYLGKALENLGVIYSQQGDEVRAEACYQRALDIMEKIFGPNHHQVAVVLHNLASSSNSQGRFEEARELYQRAMEILQKVYGTNHVALAECLGGLAANFHQQGKFREALELTYRVLEVSELAISPPKLDIAVTLNYLGELECALGKYNVALEHVEKAYSLLKSIKYDDYIIATVLNNLGEVHRHCGRYSEARKSHEKALEIRERLFGLEHPAVANSLNNLGIVFYELDELEKAIDLLNRSFEFKKTYYDPGHPLIADALNNLGQILFAQGDTSNAFEKHTQALKIRENRYGSDHPSVAESLNNLGIIYRELGNEKKALEYYEKSLEIRKRVFGYNHITVAISLNSIAILHYYAGRYKEAMEFFRRSLEISELVLGPTNPQTEGIRQNLSICEKSNKKR